MTSIMTHNLPLQGLQAGFRRFSVPEYHRLIDLGVLTEDDNLELLEGYLVHKMARNPPHDSTLSRLSRWFYHCSIIRGEIRGQMAITLSKSEPEPDLVLARVDPTEYDSHHPTPEEIHLVVEVSDSTLDSDQIDKGRIYAGANLPEYWIVNIPDKRIEVYTQPTGPGAEPKYNLRTDYGMDAIVPVILDGVEVARMPVNAILG